MPACHAGDRGCESHHPLDMKFELSEDERSRFREWNQGHLKNRHGGKEPYGGAIGGRLTFMITGTSIGQILSVKCASCGEEHCLTDFSQW